MLGGASQIVSKIRIKCNGKEKKTHLISHDGGVPLIDCTMPIVLWLAPHHPYLGAETDFFTRIFEPTLTFLLTLPTTPSRLPAPMKRDTSLPTDAVRSAGSASRAHGSAAQTPPSAGARAKASRPSASATPARSAALPPSSARMRWWRYRRIC